jgi:hypothetical protein
MDRMPTPRLEEAWTSQPLNAVNRVGFAVFLLLFLIQNLRLDVEWPDGSIDK